MTSAWTVKNAVRFFARRAEVPLTIPGLERQIIARWPERQKYITDTGRVAGAAYDLLAAGELTHPTIAPCGFLATHKLQYGPDL